MKISMRQYYGILDLYQKEKQKNKKTDELIREKIEKNKWAVEHYDCDEADYKQSQAVGAWNVLYQLLQEGDK